MNLRFIHCIYIRKLRSRFWLEEPQELRLEPSPFQFLIIVQKMRNQFEIEFPEW
jgi:hypothetical protein